MRILRHDHYRPRHHSLLVRSASFPQFARLDADTEADVVVVGAGITGLTAAYCLATSGRAVVVIDRGRCASADTGHTSAHLTMVTDAE